MNKYSKARKGERKSPPKGYPKDKSLYADPKNWKYPLDNKKRAKSAWSYINMPRNRKGYSNKELSMIESKIKKALKRYNVEISEDKKASINPKHTRLSKRAKLLKKAMDKLPINFGPASSADILIEGLIKFKDEVLARKDATEILRAIGNRIISGNPMELTQLIQPILQNPEIGKEILKANEDRKDEIMAQIKRSIGISKDDWNVDDNVYAVIMYGILQGVFVNSQIANQFVRKQINNYSVDDFVEDVMDAVYGVYPDGITDHLVIDKAKAIYENLPDLIDEYHKENYRIVPIKKGRIPKKLITTNLVPSKENRQLGESFLDAISDIDTDKLYEAMNETILPENKTMDYVSKRIQQDIRPKKNAPDPTQTANDPFAGSKGLDKKNENDGSNSVRASRLSRLSKRASDVLKGGLADGQPDEKYDPEQLGKGIGVEMEHTDNWEIAKEIAKDHLEESKDYYKSSGGKYYDKLNDMEDEIEDFLKSL
jgi:hypothetical protein